MPGADDNPWQIKDSRVAYNNRWMQVREDSVTGPSGKETIYGVVEIDDGVSIIARNDNDELYMVRVFRYPRSSWSWEFPGGGCDKESTELAAKRELLEETGLTATEWSSIGRLSLCDGLISAMQTTFVATGLKMESRPEESDEAIRDAAFFSPEKIKQMIQNGEIDSGETAASFMLYDLRQRTPAVGTHDTLA